MRARFIISSLVAVLFAFSSIAPPAQAAMPMAPEAAVAIQSVPTDVAVPQAKKAKKQLPKWACTRIYIEGKPIRPTAVKVWCNGGKTLVKLKTPGLKPGLKGSHKTVRDFRVKKGSYYDFTVYFRKLPGKQKGELRVFYYFKERLGITLRNPWKETPKESRSVVY